jgi:AhpC/TSA family
MRKSENTPAAASRPATKPSKRGAADAMRSATEYLIATRQAERALKAGNCASSFRLRDQRGVEVASATLLRHGPLLLTFYTGLWCPACSRDLQAFDSLRPSVEARGHLS